MENPHIIVMAQVGLCLSSWSQVETGMGLLFGTVGGIGDYRRAFTIFDAIVSFETRVAVLDTAMALETTHLTDEDREIWSAVSARLRKLYKKRHEVAHFSTDFRTIAAQPGIRPFFSWNKDDQGRAKFLSLKEMQERAAKFGEAAAAVTWFNGSLQQQKLPPEFRPAQIPEPPLIVRIRELRAQKKQAPPLQPQP
jgi:hypothetical protein